MTATAEIIYDYRRGRQNPAKVFEAMAGFVEAYSELGELLAESVGYKGKFTLVLDGVEVSSIKSLLRGLCDDAGSLLDRLVITSANRTLELLTEDTSTESQVNEIATVVQNSLSEGLDANIKVEPFISRRALAEVLARFSDSNSKVESGESVTFARNIEGQSRVEVPLDREWRFTGNLDEMFTDDCEEVECELSLSVKMPVNEGRGAWTFKRLDNKQTFTAHINHSTWLQDYQSSKLGGLSAKDVMRARVKFNYCRGRKGKQAEIRNAQVLEVVSVKKYNYHQGSLDVDQR